MNTQIQNIKINAAFKKYFPRIFAKIKEKKMMNTNYEEENFCFNLKKVEKYFNSRIDGLPIDIYLMPYDNMNIFTYAGFGIDKKYDKIHVYDFINKIDESFFELTDNEIIKIIHNNAAQLKIIKKKNKIILDNNLMYNPVICVTESLLNKMSDEELISLILHELGHHFYIDPRSSSFLISIINNLMSLCGLTILLLILNSENIYETKYNKSMIATIILFLGLIAVRNIMLSNINYNNQYGLDSFAVMCGYGEPLISALKKMEPNNNNINPSLLKRAFLTLKNIIYKTIKIRNTPQLYERIQKIQNGIKKLDKINWNEFDPDTVQIEEKFMDILKVMDITISKLL